MYALFHHGLDTRACLMLCEAHGLFTWACDIRNLKKLFSFKIFLCVQFSPELFLMHVYGLVDLRKGFYIDI